MTLAEAATAQSGHSSPAWRVHLRVWAWRWSRSFRRAGGRAHHRGPGVQAQAVSRWFRQLAAFAAATLAAALVLGVYNKVAFGSPFHLGYASVQGFDGMRSGLFGVTRPRTDALRGLLIGPRSLLYTSPLLVLGLLGHGISMARARQRWTAILSLIVIVYCVLLNASYVYWMAAGATGHAT